MTRKHIATALCLIMASTAGTALASGAPTSQFNYSGWPYRATPPCQTQAAQATPVPNSTLGNTTTSSSCQNTKGTFTVTIGSNGSSATCSTSTCTKGSTSDCPDSNCTYGNLCPITKATCTSGTCAAAPTAKPTVAPTKAPACPVVPTAAPTLVPTAVPTAAPIAVPTLAPTAVPTAIPTAKPTLAPTAKPTAVPTAKPTLAPTDDDNYTPSSVSAQEQLGWNLVNQDRANNGLSALTLDPELCRLARMKSTDMFQNNYFAHQSPTLGSAADMLRANGYSFSGVGENIAHHATVEKSQAAFMSSTGHRQNILGSQWTKVGIGVCYDAQGFVYVTQIFVR